MRAQAIGALERVSAVVGKRVRALLRRRDKSLRAA